MQQEQQTLETRKSTNKTDNTTIYIHINKTLTKKMQNKTHQHIRKGGNKNTTKTREQNNKKNRQTHKLNKRRQTP